MISKKHIISQCTVVILISVTVVIYHKSRLREHRGEPSNKQRYFRNYWRKTLIPVATNNANDSNSLKLVKEKSYFYDIAIVSMTYFWYEMSMLPREVHCTHSRNMPILLRQASEDDDIKRADILIFGAKIFSQDEWTELKRLRQSRQLWVHTTEESPFTSLSICPAQELNIRFNLSYTYHPEADISAPYGQLVPFHHKQIRPFKSNFNKKSKLMLWVSSHCLTLMWRRSDFAHDLAKYLPLDTYGACGTLDCPKHQSNCTEIFKSYKFYLAMENSCCGGYITEKFWNALTNFEAIPVVVGAPRRDYEKLAPNNSFIHADDFSSIEKLADFIMKVSKSQELYDSYFQWKRHGIAKSNPISSILAFTEKGVCRLTEYLESLDTHSFSNRSFDPYGPNWFGGCNECGNHDWLKKYSNFNRDLRIKQQARFA